MATIYSHIDSNKRKSIFLIIFFFIFVILLGWLFGYLTEIGYFGIIIAAFIALFMILISYFSGDKLALSIAGAKKLSKKEDLPYVWRMVENLSITAGIQAPKIYIIKDEAPNAFATGRDPEHSSIALTTGLISSLENEELEGVIAHELSHIKNYDIRIMMIVIVLVGTIALLADILIRINIFGGGRKSDNGGGQLGVILMIAGLVLAILSPLIAKLIQLAISRKREFLADADGALLTRYPEGLAKALKKIGEYKKPIKRANNATAHLYISSPFSGKKGFFTKMFSTHPPINDRITALNKMASINN